MTHRELVLAALHHEETDVVPYTLFFEGGTDIELDRFYGSTAWRDDLQCCFDWVACLDTVVERPYEGNRGRDAFGSIWRSDMLPWHLETPAMAKPRLDCMKWPTQDDFPRTVEADIAKRTGPDASKFSLIAMGWGLFEQTWRIRGFEQVLMDLATDPEFYEEFIGKITDYFLEFVERCRDIPADAIFFGDDWGDQRGVIMGPERWRKLIKPCWAKIYDAVHAQNKLVVSHCCGSIADIMPDIIEIGLDVLESVQPEAAGMDPFELKRKYGDKITFWGCLGSQSTLQHGTPADIGKHIDWLCAEVGKDGGFILSSAKAIQPGTPVENAAAAVEAFKRQNLR
jgi:uroporphyrinogen decarboxylase